MNGDPVEFMTTGIGQQAFSPVAGTVSSYGGEEGPENASKDNLHHDEEMCRICHVSGDEDGPLYHPCECRGSMKFVHQDCLQQWLNYRIQQGHRDNEKCDICKHTFEFHPPVYAENTPSRLPLQELLSALASRTDSITEFATRILVILWAYLIFFQGLFVTCRILRYTLVRSLHLHMFMISHFTPGMVLDEWWIELAVDLIGMILGFEIIDDLTEGWAEGVFAVANFDRATIPELQALFSVIFRVFLYFLSVTIKMFPYVGHQIESWLHGIPAQG